MKFISHYQKTVKFISRFWVYLVFVDLVPKLPGGDTQVACTSGHIASALLQSFLDILFFKSGSGFPEGQILIDDHAPSARRDMKGDGRSSAATTPSSLRATIRSMMFFSSRTLPG